MSELTTVARPYAKAAFDYAVEQGTLEAWDDMLQFSAAVAADESIQALLSGNLVPEQMADVFVQICGNKLDGAGQNLVKVMAENGRLAALPQVAEQFAALRTEYEQVVHVEVNSASELSKAQESTLVTKLTDRFGRKVELACTVDETLIGGFVARAGDLVIDESVRGQLARLNDAMNSLLGMSMQLNSTEISELIKQRIAQFDVVSEARTEGTIVSVADGIIRINGLRDVMQGEMIELPDNRFAMALNLERDSVGAVVMGSYEGLAEGTKVNSTGRILQVPVGRGLLGRVVNALGEPIDGKGPAENDGFEPIEKIAPGVMTRKSVGQPMQTGYKAVDSMVPIGRGQRELVIGDRQTGKTALAVDTIINQKGTGVKCIYVAIGQKNSTVANVVRKLEEHGAMEYTTIVAATASESAALLYISAYSGCTMGEYYRDRGEDALIIYDDLSKQAVAYRQVALLLRRPPGREAFPGDVFYLHSRLLERAARVNEDYVEEYTKGEVKGQTGSLTALPIIETQAGDVSAFVPTNVISITDGQIFLETELFNAGIRPAVNAGISVSRVGGAAQTKIIKKLGGGIRLALAQYRELAAFSQFASDLDEATRSQLEHGQRVTELMKQKQYAPLSTADMAISLYAADKGYLKDIELNKIGDFEAALHAYFNSEQAELVAKINETGDFDDEIEKGLKGTIETFKSTQSW